MTKAAYTLHQQNQNHEQRVTQTRLLYFYLPRHILIFVLMPRVYCLNPIMPVYNYHQNRAIRKGWGGRGGRGDSWVRVRAFIRPAQFVLLFKRGILQLCFETQTSKPFLAPKTGGEERGEFWPVSPTSDTHVPQRIPAAYIIPMFYRTKPCRTYITTLFYISMATDRGSKGCAWDNLGEGGAARSENIYCSTVKTMIKKTSCQKKSGQGKGGQRRGILSKTDSYNVSLCLFCPRHRCKIKMERQMDGIFFCLSHKTTQDACNCEGIVATFSKGPTYITTNDLMIPITGPVTTKFGQTVFTHRGT